MRLVFMDEKGPQNSFKITKPFNRLDKLQYANDSMHSYVANAIQINEKYYKTIEKEYIELVNEYLTNRPQLRNSLEKKGKELKGLELVRKNFKYGIASMKGDEIKFYSKLLDLLEKFKVENLLFMISKMSIITSSRLTNFLYFISELGISSFLLKYVLTKYAEIEASEEVITALLDKQTSTQKILMLIRDDMSSIIRLNKGNKRMEIQNNTYEQAVLIINTILKNKIVLPEPDLPLSFDWRKVYWAFDLWKSEEFFSGKKNYRIYLDEGISEDAFKKLKHCEVIKDCDSKDWIGLQITDMIVVLIGKLISQLYSCSKYDFNVPDQRVLVEKEYFRLTEPQFELVNKINCFILGRNTKFHFINDSFFDDAVLLQTYLGYLSSFESYESYSEVTSESHPLAHFEKFKYVLENKFKESLKNECLAKKIYGNVEAAVENGGLRPL